MEFYEEARKLGVPDIDITQDEWEKEYSNSYSVMLLDGSDADKILAAEDIIKTYLVLQAREKINPTDCPYCKGTGKGNMNGVEVGCIMCGKTGKKTRAALDKDA